jgi:hypothetical protein
LLMDEVRKAIVRKYPKVRVFLALSTLRLHWLIFLQSLIAWLAWWTSSDRHYTYIYHWTEHGLSYLRFKCV